MNEADVIRLRHMADAAAEALEFARGRSRSDLDTDRMLLRALVKDVEIIGEAAAKVTEATQRKTAAIPWQAIVTMRNRLVHGYFDINFDIVWSTITDDLPALLVALEKLLPPLR